MTTGARLKIFLKSRGVTQTYVSRQLGIGIKAFNAVLNDKAPLKADVLEQVCHIIGSTPVDFFAYNFQADGKTA